MQRITVTDHHGDSFIADGSIENTVLLQDGEVIRTQQPSEFAAAIAVLTQMFFEHEFTWSEDHPEAVEKVRKLFEEARTAAGVIPKHLAKTAG